MENYYRMKLCIFSVKDVSTLLFVNDATVRDWIKTKELKAFTQGSKKEGYLIFGDDLNDFLKKHPKYYEKFFDGLYKTDTYLKNSASAEEWILRATYGHISQILYSILIKNFCDKVVYVCIFSNDRVDKIKKELVRKVMNYAEEEYYKKISNKV